MAVIGALMVSAPLVSTATAAQAEPTAPPNAVITWDINAQNAIFEVARQGPTTAARSFAIVTGSVYDAVNAIAGAPYEPLLVAPPSRPGDSTPAAVSTAAYRTLLWMFPGQADALRTRYEESLATIPDGPAKSGGIAVGEATAAAMIQNRTGDGADPTVLWPESTVPGKWRAAPPLFSRAGGWYPDLKPFVLDDPGRYRTPGPPALTSARYALAQKEVQLFGSENSKVRTDEQRDVAVWWDDPRMVEWSIRRQLATNHRLSTLQTARMFAMTDVTAADALIPCYQEKRRWNLWRPVTAIRLADTDGNPATRPDPSWTPLRNTAPSPEYPSGHTCYTGAVMAGLRTFFGRETLTFSAFSTDSDSTRRYHSTSQAMEDVKDARVWAGVHYRFASDDGERLGVVASQDVLSNAFGRR
jgi:hypothetical protein